MISRTSAATNRPPRHPRGFTLVEMLVVIAIILVLAGMLYPALIKAWRTAQRTSTKNDLHSIAVALEAYKQDWGYYPPVRLDPALIRVDYSMNRSSDDQKWRPNPQTGAEVLCYALMGLATAVEPTGFTVPPGMRPRADGADGPGFRVRPGGKVYPPYLATDRFKFGAREDSFKPNTKPEMVMHFNILDRNNMPILYYPASTGKPNLSAAAATPNRPYGDSSYVTGSASPAATVTSEASLYDADDNLIWFMDEPFTAMTTLSNGEGTGFIQSHRKAHKRFLAMIGDRHNAAPLPNPPASADANWLTLNATIEPTTEKAIVLPFLLWAAGPDERFGPDLFSSQSSTTYTLTYNDVERIKRCDDVTNFRD